MAEDIIKIVIAEFVIWSVGYLGYLFISGIAEAVDADPSWGLFYIGCIALLSIASPIAILGLLSDI